MFPINFPPSAEGLESPQWNGRQFLIGNSFHSILEYSENFSGWSDNLTALHEEVCGDTHPIDVASRHDAITQVGKCNPNSAMVIMEIGCSSGFLIRDLVKYFPGIPLVGADVVKEPLYRLADSLPGVPLVRFDLLKCPLPSSSVDILIMLNVLEHIQDDLGALGKAFQLLKPGGSLILEVPAGPSLFDSYDQQLQHFRRYSLLELRKKLETVGFKVSRLSHLGFIIFPAFAAVKYLNKLFPKKDTNLVVRDGASRTGSSILVNFAMKFESKYLKNCALPFGIRLLVTAKKSL